MSIKPITRSIERDAYIMAQALYVAIKTMESVEPDYLREPSNIADMKLILSTVYPQYEHVFIAKDTERKAHLASLALKGAQDDDCD